MSLNKIDLSPVLLESLYPDTLVFLQNNPKGTSNETQPLLGNKITEKKSQLATHKWLGNNEKNILIVVNHADAVFLPDAEHDFLINILGACKLSLNDVALINHNSYKTLGWNEITGYFKSKIVLLFDVEPSAWGLPLGFPMYQVQSFNNITFLYTPLLQTISADPIEKSKLWICLKKLFNISK